MPTFLKFKVRRFRDHVQVKKRVFIKFSTLTSKDRLAGGKGQSTAKVWGTHNRGLGFFLS